MQIVVNLSYKKKTRITPLYIYLPFASNSVSPEITTQVFMSSSSSTKTNEYINYSQMNKWLPCHDAAVEETALSFFNRIFLRAALLN